jgi:hypothetical protein
MCGFEFRLYWQHFDPKTRRAIHHCWSISIVEENRSLFGYRRVSSSHLSLPLYLCHYLTTIYNRIHKNGTWAVQKIIQCAQSTEEFTIIAQHLRPFTPPLLLNDCQLGQRETGLSFTDCFRNYSWQLRCARDVEIRITSLRLHFRFYG